MMDFESAIPCILRRSLDARGHCVNRAQFKFIRCISCGGADAASQMQFSPSPHYDRRADPTNQPFYCFRSQPTRECVSNLARNQISKCSFQDGYQMSNMVRHAVVADASGCSTRAPLRVEGGSTRDPSPWNASRTVVCHFYFADDYCPTVLSFFEVIACYLECSHASATNRGGTSASHTKLLLLVYQHHTLFKKEAVSMKQLRSLPFQKFVFFKLLHLRIWLNFNNVDFNRREQSELPSIIQFENPNTSFPYSIKCWQN